ncbi:MAG: Ig-like domain-containing protein, partial [Candidatus Marsarchaeota archaeon]|nr:Ig-like domain-containing protein [Candidatus Marsarchaeota archaeon]
MKFQSAVEFLTTYGWAILVIAVVISFLYFFILAPSNLVPTQCTTSSELNCQDMVFGANQLISKTVFFLTNAQSYPIENPSVFVNVSGVGVGTGTCSPNYVLPGGAIICNVTFTKPLRYGSLIDGKISLSGNVCTNLATPGCVSSIPQTYQGNFNTHVVPILSQTGLNVTIISQGPFLADGNLYKITAKVKLLGYPLPGATVNFTTNGKCGTISQQYMTTDSNGNATTYLSSESQCSGSLNATFGGHTNTTNVTFLKPVYATFSMNQPNTGYAVVTVGGVPFSNLPITVAFAPNSIASYSFQSIVQDTASERYAFSSVVDNCNGGDVQSG